MTKLPISGELACGAGLELDRGRRPDGLAGRIEEVAEGVALVLGVALEAGVLLVLLVLVLVVVVLLAADVHALL
jgi:hypothetical protein